MCSPELMDRLTSEQKYLTNSQQVLHGNWLSELNIKILQLLLQELFGLCAMEVTSALEMALMILRHLEPHGKMLKVLMVTLSKLLLVKTIRHG